MLHINLTSGITLLIKANPDVHREVGLPKLEEVK